MLVELKPFQEAAVNDLLTQCRFAAAEIATGNPQAVVLAAPTGSGKTIMVTATLEALAEGYEDVEGDPEATFIWLSDLPELNEQTRRKMQASSSSFGPDDIITIANSFDQETFQPGKVYFLNTQKLRDGSLLTAEGDLRTYTIWETIRNTVEERRQHVWLVIDEAHKGMGVSATERARSQTIIRKFVEGSDEIPPFPLVIGLSATPQRFTELIANTPRMDRRVQVTPENVRDSGLLKDSIVLYHPREAQPADVTLLKEAAKRLVEFGGEWDAYYSQGQEGDPIKPILVVQVEDRSQSHEVTKTDLEDALQALEEVLGPLESEQIAHAFQEGTNVEIGNRTVRYCAPSDIQQDEQIRIIFFKTSLNTGWDCPRAEVMMSFRKAVDYTLIAQLVGRMVRTPLARRIETTDFLNSVSLYLPHYNEEGLEEIVGYLQDPDPGELPQLEIKLSDEVIELDRNPGFTDCFEVAERVPTYIVSSVRKVSNIRRLMKLAWRLATDGIVPDAMAQARVMVLGHLKDAYEASKDTDEFKNLVKDHGELDLRAVDYQYGIGQVTGDDLQVPITQQNVDDLFDAAGRKIGNGLHKLYWKERVTDGSPKERMLAKLETFALVGNVAVMKELDKVSRDKLQAWFEEHWTSSIRNLPGDRREAYHQIRQTAKEPERVTLTLRDSLLGKKAATKWEKHLYVAANGLFPYDFSQSSWERKVLEVEQEKDDYAGFLRNEPRKDWSLTVPYKKAGVMKPQYPDLLIFRRRGDDAVVDILDPHNPNLSDWWQKAVGLADYAAKHGQVFGRIELIFIEGDNDIRRLDLKNEVKRNDVLAVTSNEHLAQLFNNP